jgi:hypothetical protein
LAFKGISQLYKGLENTRLMKAEIKQLPSRNWIIYTFNFKEIEIDRNNWQLFCTCNNVINKKDI